MRWYIPREHGAWAMFIVPYWIGAAISGITGHHVIFFAGLTAVFFAQAPLLTFIRQPKHKDIWPSFTVYSFFGMIILLPYLLSDITLMFIFLSIFPLFCINILFAKIKKERLFINDAVAITALSALLLPAYVLGAGSLAAEAFQYAAISIIFFLASVFHVKSLLRERNNRTFKKMSYGYHVLITAAAFLTGWYGAATAYLMSLLKTVFVPRKFLQKPMQIGIIEIINSLAFITLVIIAYYV